jgi:hypothetical protein
VLALAGIAIAVLAAGSTWLYMRGGSAPAAPQVASTPSPVAAPGPASPAAQGAAPAAPDAATAPAPAATAAERGPPARPAPARAPSPAPAHDGRDAAPERAAVDREASIAAERAAEARRQDEALAARREAGRREAEERLAAERAAEAKRQAEEEVAARARAEAAAKADADRKAARRVVVAAPTAGARPEGLRPEQLQAVIRANRSGLEECAARALTDPASAPYAGRKVSLILLVGPNGRAEAALEDETLDPTPFGTCLRRATARMAFPEFSGEPVGAVVPLQLGRAP